MGGGAIRTVAKAAAIGSYRSPGLFSGQAAASSAARRASFNTGVTVPATDGVPAVSLSASEKHLTEAAPLQRPAWELDDWDFADWPVEGEVVVDALQPKAPRLVFGPVPSLEEAKEATSDLSDALEKVYFSSPTATSVGTEALAMISPMPKHVVQTFSLLQQNPEAQEVVASLASDKNVWEAVMKNQKVMEFYRSQQSTFSHPEVNEDSEESDATSKPSWRAWESPRTPTTENESSKKSGFAGFWSNVTVRFEEMVQNTKAKLEEMVQITKAKVEEVVHNTKVKVEKMVKNISSFFEDLLGTSTETSNLNNPKTFMALAIAVILVILVKRG